MLAELTMKLKMESGDRLGFYQASRLQGVLMSEIDTEYASVLHQQGLNPYSQCVLKSNDGSPEWHIRTLDKDAYENIILPMMRIDFNEFQLERRDKTQKIQILQKCVRTIEDKTLLEDFYSDDHNKEITIEFQSPTAFKVNGRYWTLPEPRLIFQSLMNKYSSSSENMDMFDEETLGQIVERCSIGKFWLKSASFPLESVWIPSFEGNMAIRVQGNATLARYVRLLCRFGEFSGVGIKTAMGMGAMKILSDREDRETRETEAHISDRREEAAHDRP